MSRHRSFRIALLKRAIYDDDLPALRAVAKSELSYLLEEEIEESAALDEMYANEEVEERVEVLEATENEGHC